MSQVLGKHWRKVLLVAGGGLALRYLLKQLLSKDEEDGDGADGAAAPAAVVAVDGAVAPGSKEEVLEIFDDIAKSQEEARKHMQQISKEVLSKSLSLAETCQLVKALRMRDPLAIRGLTPLAFDGLLAKHQEEPAVQQAVAKVMGAPIVGVAGVSEAAQSMTTKQIVDIHTFMLAEFEKLVALPNKGAADAHTLTFAAQALVGAKTQEKFGVLPEDVESAVLLRHGALASDPKFSALNGKLEKVMAELAGPRRAG